MSDVKHAMIPQRRRSRAARPLLSALNVLELACQQPHIGRLLHGSLRRWPKPDISLLPALRQVHQGYRAHFRTPQCPGMTAMIFPINDLPHASRSIVHSILGIRVLTLFLRDPRRSPSDPWPGLCQDPTSPHFRHPWSLSLRTRSSSTTICHPHSGAPLGTPEVQPIVQTPWMCWSQR